MFEVYFLFAIFLTKKLVFLHCSGGLQTNGVLNSSHLVVIHFKIQCNIFKWKVLVN